MTHIAQRVARSRGIVPRLALAAVLSVVAASLGVPAVASAAIVTTRASVPYGTGAVESDGQSVNARISADGRYVAFESDAGNLVTGDLPGSDVFVRDLQTGVTMRVSSAAGGMWSGSGQSFTPAISGDGRFVAFVSDATNLVLGQTASGRGVYRWEMATGRITRVDLSDAGVPGGWAVRFVAIDHDGSRVAFVSVSPDLVAQDTNNKQNVFVRDMVAQTTRLVSTGASPPDGHSIHPSINGDGTRVVFTSSATNLVALDTNGRSDVFVADLSTTTPTVKLVSGTSELRSDGSSDYGVISSDGKYAAFVSDATNLGASGPLGTTQVYLRLIDASTLTCTSVGAAGTPGNGASTDPGISASGGHVSFISSATNLSGAAEGGVFLRDRSAGTTARVSGDVGSPATMLGAYTALSADGRFVAFESASPTATVGGIDTNGLRDVFRAEMWRPVLASLSTPRLSTSLPHRYRYFYVSGTINKHPSKTSVRLYFYRKVKVGGVYKYALQRFVTVSVPANTSSYKLRYRVSYSGSWQVRARHLPHVGHLDTWSKIRSFYVLR